MPHPQTDRNLLLGILALQNNFVSREMLLAAFSAWVADKSKSLGEILVEQGKLQRAYLEVLGPLVAAHIEQHEGAAEKSLAAIDGADELKGDLERLGDADLQSSLGHVSSGRKPKPAGSNDPGSVRVGQTTSKGLRFRVLRPHAEGGLGTVSLARDDELNRDVALKEIRPQYADDEDSRARFLREAEITGGLEHPCIVPVYGLGQYADGRPFYAMRFIKGDSLKDAIEKFHGPAAVQIPSTSEGTPTRPTGDNTPASGGSGSTDAQSAGKTRPTLHNPFRDPARHVELRKLLQRFIDVCEAIEYAHARGVLHRDLKPGNIMLGKYGETLVVDWGLAKAIATAPHAATAETLPIGAEEPLSPQSGDKAEPTLQGLAVGTPAFMPPEQAAGRLDLLGPASDVYSLGATLYALLTGQPPVSGKRHAEVLRKVEAGQIVPPRTANPHLPRSLEAICLKALALKPENRYGSARQLAADVERWLADEPVVAYREPLRSQVARWFRRRQTLATGISVALVLCVVAAAAGVFMVGAYNQTLQGKNAELETSNRNLDAARKKSDALAREERRLRLAANFEQARSSYDRASLLRERGELDASLLWLVRALEELEAIERELETEGDAGLAGKVTSLWHSAESSLAAQITYMPNTMSRLWNFGASNPVGQPLSHDGEVISLSYSPDGSRLATTTFDGVQQLWDPVSGNRIGEPLRRGVPQDARAAADRQTLVFSPNSQWFALAASPREAGLGDTGTGALSATRFPHADVHGLAFSPDNSLLATAGSDNMVRLWSIGTGTPRGVLRHDRRIEGLAFSPDGKTLATVAGDKTRLWSVARGELLAETLSLGFVSVKSVRFMPDGENLATTHSDSTARVWNAQTLKPVGDRMRHSGSITSLAVSPDSKTVATASYDKTSRLWEASTGQPVGEPLRHEARVNSVAFGPSGSLVATASFDGTARLWDAATCQPLGEAMRHTGPIHAVAFSPSGATIATAGNDRTVRLWPLIPDFTVKRPVLHTRIWLEVVTGACLDQTTVRRLAGDEEWQEKSRQLADLGGPPSAAQPLLEFRREQWRRAVVQNAAEVGKGAWKLGEIVLPPKN